jgi:tetratricopeptide (TPR) repeat protein
LHDGLSRGSKLIDLQAPGNAMQEYETSAKRTRELEARAEALEDRPGDAAALLEFAASAVARALEWPDRHYADLLMQDAQDAALQAQQAGAKGPQLEGVLALTAAELGDREGARTHAIAAVEGGLMHRGASGAAQSAEPESAWTGLARTRLLRLFAEARQSSIRRAYRAGEAWPPEWLSDLSAAYALLLADPRVEAAQLVESYDFLRWIGAAARADQLLEDALARFPDTPVLHERLRGLLLWQGGPDKLEQAYAEQLRRPRPADAAPTQLRWFAGYASLVAAEQHRRAAEFEAAVGAYQRAIDHFEGNLEQFPDGKDNCLHYIALAHAGLARMALERGALEQATDELLASLKLRPDSAATLDGLGLTAVMTAKMLAARLVERGDGERAAAVQAALDALDPKLLEPPPSELTGGAQRGRQGNGGRGRPPAEAQPRTPGNPDVPNGGR